MPNEEDEAIEHIDTAQCGACQEEIPVDSKSCPKCGVSFSGVKEVDMEGINSPQRGWFKMSFGGNTIPYFNLTLNGN